MTQKDIRNKFLEGGKIAIERLLEKKRKDNSFVVISDDGKVVKLDPRTLKKK